MEKGKHITSKKQVRQKAVSLLLFVLFLFPNAIQFAHAFDGHKHTTCKEVNTHYHETLIDCEICDFHFVPLTYEIYDYPDFLVSTIPTASKKHFTTLLYTPFHTTNTQLRAPPYFLV
ncbi:hypothetical protein [Cellulophaga sp. Hel_I_12]|uniref:hypothetical protein n=1 Tax=Cellulophaga sp. Hel_I_12 TaxID=1249972 RepID=UPI00064918B9|nr:hypothetical protein [Cellulophaga sp. Hel_I_12]